MPLLENAVVIVQRDFAAHADRSVLDARDVECGAFARCDVERMRSPCRYLRAILRKLKRERLEHVLHFPVARLERAVGENGSVHHELAVVRLVAEIATVGDDEVVFGLWTSDFGLRALVEPLVHPVPDCRAEDHVRRLDRVLVVLEVAHRVAHVVRVFGDVERLLRLVVVCLPHGPVDARILVGIDVRHGVVALVLDRTRGVHLLDRGGRGGEVLSRPRLVAEAPEHDGRMVAVAAHHVEIARDGRLLPLLAVRERRLAVVVAVRFHVCLVEHVDAVDVAEVVPVVVLGIVRVAHVVDVRLLHEADVLKLPLARHVVSVHRI